MILACDIGNTNIVLGCFKKEQLISQVRIKTDQQRTADEFRILLLSALRHKLGADVSFSKAIISSVVPPVTPAIVELIQEDFDLQPLVVGPGTKTGLSIQTKDPAAVGSDRIVNAVAAKQLYGTPAIIIDFGTAISFDLVDADDCYCGGIIAPGLEVSLNALVANTAKLPKIPLVRPERVVGNDTISAMQSGFIYGFEGLVNGLVRRIKDERTGIKHVVATGGAGKLIAELSSEIDSYSADLTLQGLRILANIN